MKRTFFASLILALLLGCFGICTSAEDAQTIVVNLPANPSTGYTWVAASDQENVIRIEDLGFSMDDGDLVGAPGVMQLEVCGVAPGSAALTLSYTRPWEEDAVPTVSFTWNVTVDEANNVALSGDLDMPTVADSGYHWLFVQDAPEVLEIAESDVPGSYHLNALTDGTDNATFGYLSAGNTRMLWAYELEVLVQNGAVYVPSVFFYHAEGLDPFAPEIPFTTTDREGNEFTEAIFAEHTLTVLNFWEPWCGPCVSEMPALQKLSEEYADKGVLVVGIYSTPDMEDDVAAVLESTGVQYPILHYTTDFDLLQTGYVPTTVIVDSNGRIVNGPFSGSMNYGAWASLIEGLL